MSFTYQAVQLKQPNSSKFQSEILTRQALPFVITCPVSQLIVVVALFFWYLCDICCLSLGTIKIVVRLCDAFALPFLEEPTQ